MRIYPARFMMKVQTPDPVRIPDYIYLLSEAHERSGMSLREVAQASDLDPTYVHYILKGARRPQRDVIIALGITHRLERVEVDEILLLAGLPPLGRSALREYRHHQVFKAG
ncbi:MAG TPA: helix-turn-helix transcriptional regulator [Anaerolineales bacterium]